MLVIVLLINQAMFELNINDNSKSLRGYDCPKSVHQSKAGRTYVHQVTTKDVAQYLPKIISVDDII